MAIKHFINLSNGIEAIPNICLYGPFNEIDDESIKQLNFTYVASTTLENKNYIKLFADLDHNLLFNLAIGNVCYFYDFGTNRPFSKTCYIGVPLIVYCLTRFWFDIDNKELAYRYCRRGETTWNEHARFSAIYADLFLHNTTKEKQWVKTKLAKYKNCFLTGTKVNLIPVSKSTSHDGDREFFKSIIKTYL